jgi:hypothetical protein
VGKALRSIVDDILNNEGMRVSRKRGGGATALKYSEIEFHSKVMKHHVACISSQH